MSEHTEGTLRSGQYWQGWTPDGDVKGVVVIVHGAHEHSGRYSHVAERFATSGYATYALDHPGHGKSPGKRGNIGSMDETVAGVDALARKAAGLHPGVPLFVYGHSMGGLVTMQYITGNPVELAGAVLSAPLLDTSAASAIQRFMAGLLSRVVPNLGVLQLDATAVSRDPEVVRAYQNDPLNYNGKIRARTGAEMLKAVNAMPGRLAGVKIPILVFHGSADRLVPPVASENVKAAAGSPDLIHKVYDGLFHEPHNEPEQEAVLGDVLTWLDAHL